MSGHRFYLVRENGKESDVSSHYGAALLWEKNPEGVEVFETAPDPTSKVGSCLIVRKVEPGELKEILKSSRM